MSIFFCKVHNKLEDSDYVGYHVIGDLKEVIEVCDEGKAELEDEEEKV